MKVKEIKALNDAARKKELTSLIREQFNLRMQQATGQTTSVARFKQIRRDVARIKTIMREEQLKSEKAV